MKDSNLNINNKLKVEKSSTLSPQLLIQIQYISQGETIATHLQNIELVCKAGCRWVQLRLKNVSLIEYLNAAQKCRAICDTYEAIFIVNDNVGIASEAKADGVHLGLTDTNPKKARKQLGDNVIIGGTANTLEDCVQHIKNGVDYIGLGPFRFTTTKNKLSPILGLEGYKKIVSELFEQGYKIPVIAIGGIKLEDINNLSKTGIGGIAVSGLLSGLSIEELENRVRKMNFDPTNKE